MASAPVDGPRRSARRQPDPIESSESPRQLRLASHVACCSGIDVHHHHCDHPTSTAPLITALLASSILACSLVDDEPPVADTEMAAAHFGEPLAQCDGTRFRRRSDGSYEVSALAAGGLLARIGLERGDTILAVDGEPMHEADRIVAKAMDLFMGGHLASVLTLVV